jgi:hypothetical protein
MTTADFVLNDREQRSEMLVFMGSRLRGNDLVRR